MIGRMQAEVVGEPECDASGEVCSVPLKITNTGSRGIEVGAVRLDRADATSVDRSLRESEAVTVEVPFTAAACETGYEIDVTALGRPGVVNADLGDRCAR